MGVEVVGFENAPSPIEADNSKSVSHEKESGTAGEHIKFGSHENGSIKADVNKVSDANFPKDAVDEWPEHKVHYFYFVRCRPLDDPNIKAKMDHADKDIVRWTQARFQTINKLKDKRSERGEIISQLKPLDAENKQFNIMVDGKRKEMEPLQQALGKLRTANTAGRGSGLCSSEEELNEVIQSLNYRISHESISLAEEKQILRDIKQLEGTRDKVIANAAMRTKLQDSLGQKEVIQDQVKLMGVDLDGVRKDQQAIKARIKNLRDELVRVDEDIKSLQEELSEVTEKKDRAYKNMQELRKLRDEGNTLFFENRTLLNKVRDLAAKKDVQALQELSLLEVDKFISSWSSSKSLRNDYEKRLLQSLDGRQMSKDGRSRNPNEKPLVAVENPAPPQTEAVAKFNPKKTKEEPKAAPQKEAAPTQKPRKEAVEKATEPEFASEDVGSVAKENTGSKKLVKEPEVESQVDAEKLKEMKREEQIVKAKQAMERKKKLAEKNAAKAAIKAEKEAQKKLKEREKKLKKKAATSAPATNSEEQADEATEQEEDPTPEAPALEKEKEKFQREKIVVRHRGRPRGSESIPKIIPKRKKSTNYWVWAAPAAVALVLLLIALGYQYFA
ncbi:proton pump-interactor 1-like [Punica granatum]|uniref:Proton pump-interactor 1-like n=2 Tax=Punica granatum TaxID=22663 RepID=A0A6P8E3S2_PUNGR|nr:proton pump-interactor 1-like [Punica granatum]XP_031404592.1 proton pump-interactor 1-like [Punica granatum]OWM88654.1 hypothetical protein CDL15_Pgr002421 [Punica granatum]PKI37638.1 hypothetical protein CRG98_041931 [Punica granatum]